jgi:2-methylisocitrate lyase-like PEP mutase family enzyme
VLAHPSLTVAELGELGVRRVSSGSLPYRAAVDAAVNVANALRDGQPVAAATPYWENAIASRVIQPAPNGLTAVSATPSTTYGRRRHGAQ